MHEAWKSVLVDEYGKSAVRGTNRARIAELNQPATDIELQRLRKGLGGPIPTPVEELLRHSNGVTDELCLDGKWSHGDWVVWHCEYLEFYNSELREGLDDEGLDGGRFFFFTNMGTSQFGLYLQPPNIGEIWRWNPIAGELETFAPSFRAFVAICASEDGLSV